MSATEVLDDYEAGELSVEFEGLEPWEVLEWAIERFGDRLALSTAFQDGDVALVDMAYRIDPEVRVFSIDTGRLPQETHDLVEELRERYPGLRLELLSPDGLQVQRLVDRNGPNLFLRSVEQRLLCCNVRKVQPLNRALAGLDCWVTGLRRDQWASRSDIRKVEIDHDHDAIVKLNPLAEWTHDEVWDYLRANDVPTHALYAQGFTSIGCVPCTRPIAPGQPTRAGRWWWETDAPKECGMHCSIETGGFEHELHAILGDAPLHALINNAGYSPKAEGGRRLGCLDGDMEVWEKTFAINFMAPVFFSRACAPMLASAGGAIVNITSIAGHRVHPFAGSAYSTSKAALTGLTARRPGRGSPRRR